MKKILFLALHRPGRSPGQRYRFESFWPDMKSYGFEYEISYLISEEEDRFFYRPGNYLKKGLTVIRSFLKRWTDAGRAKDFDLVYLYRDTQFLGNSIIEKKIKRSGTPMIFDFDDAIWIRDVSEGNSRFGFLKDTRKIPVIISLCDTVIAGNQFLADYAKQFNPEVSVLPSVIDTKKYFPLRYAEKEKICIGWTGSLSTMKHFMMIIPVLKKLKENYGSRIYFKVIGDETFRSDELEIKGVPWNAKSEAEDLAEMDIGIMPLPDEIWSKGKCSMKGLQYMGMGIPAVMSNIGMNKEVIIDGKNGFLAGTDEEWVTKLSILIENMHLREMLGKEGRRTVEEKYSIEAVGPAFFQSLIKTLK